MSLDSPTFDASGPRVGIRRAAVVDCDEFLALAQASLELVRPWLEPPTTRERFYSYLRSRQTPTDDGFLICERSSNRIVGVININCIVRGYFQSAYLGYWIGASFAKQGYMTEAMGLLTRYAFTEMNLHRLEANIQPENLASIALVRKCGFKKEGFSPRYLQVNGQWHDHERWTIRVEDL
jgi:[ribosomal protein S5]-alanine N-acetyltransferase